MTTVFNTFTIGIVSKITTMLETLLRAELNKDGSGGGETTVVSLHCSQMKEWGVRGGAVELRAIQDDGSNRRFNFINRIWQHNELEHRLEYVMDALTCRGEVLWYLQEDPDNPGMYLIEFFVGGQNNPNPEYKVFYREGGRVIEKIIIRYSYDYELHNTKQKKWVQLVINEEVVQQSEGLQKPDFNQLKTFTPSNVKSFRNPFFPYLPCVISKNNPRRLGQKGVGDFDNIRSLIETHEQLVSKAHKNLRIFSNPILVTTRKAEEVMSRTHNWNNTWAAANRYYDLTGTPYSGSTSTHDVRNFGEQRTPMGTDNIDSSEGTLDTIFGNVDAGERFGFIQADPVSGDQNLWIRSLRELIHWILGGIDPLGISASSTFGEIKTLFGRVQNSADKKASSLYGQTGLCKIFERILWKEEIRYKEALFRYIKLNFPQLSAQINEPREITDDFAQQVYELKQSGFELLQNMPQLPGILPLGDRTLVWRYTREVFQNTTREQLDRSIAARNEREDGLTQEWVLRKQYPNMTDQEIKNAMSGFSPRVVEAAAGSINSLIRLYAQFMQIPDPKDPEQAWGLSLGLPELLEQSLSTLRKEIAYGQPEYQPADEHKSPLTFKDILAKEQIRADELPLSVWRGGTRVAPTTLSDAVAMADRLYRAGLPR